MRLRRVESQERKKRTAGGRREGCQCRRDLKGQGDLEKGLGSVETVLGLKVGGWKKSPGPITFMSQ